MASGSDVREAPFAGRTVLITGASQNMGRSTALAFAKEGANLALCTSQKMAELEQVAAEARSHGVDVVACRCDVTDPAAVGTFIEAAAVRFGGADIVINLAGYRVEGKFLETTPEAWTRNIEVNLGGPFNICRAALPYMMKKQWGRIINMSGVSPFIGGTAAKSMVKLGIVGLTRGLAREFARYNITANCVGPGYIGRDTDSPEEAATRTPPPEVPIRRQGTSAEVISVIRFLASADASYVTGQCYLANGGAYFL